MTWVKVCGMTNVEDALVAVDAGADAVGFVFYENSPRCVRVDAVREIAGQLPGRIDKIGVFVNESPERVMQISDEAGLTAVQFHGDEYKESQRYSVGGKVFFCVPMAEILHSPERSGMPHLPKAAAVILDSGNKEQRGGTGRAFAWDEAQGFVSALREQYPVVIAGGLTPSNVASALACLKPWGVDVVSGVECRPGKKDPEKVRAFVRAVREADRKVS